MQIRSDIPACLDEVDEEFLTKALRHAGLIDNETVQSFETDVIGEGAGFLGEVVRLHLNYSGDVDRAPATMILKIPTALKNRRVGQFMGVYEREIRFYSSLRKDIDLRTPELYFGALDVVDDPELLLKALGVVNRLPMFAVRWMFLLGNWLGGKVTRNYVLLIEDLKDYRVGDQVAGCSVEEAKLAIDTMVDLHGKYWNSAELKDYPWVVPLEIGRKMFHVVYLQALPGFLEDNSSWLTEQHHRLLEWLRVNAVSMFERVSESDFSMLHGDFRLDNMCFDNDEIIMFDWQTLLAGPPGMELAYFLSAMPDDVSEETLMSLVDYYGEQLRSRGIDFSNEELHWQYQMGLLVLLHRVSAAQHQDVLEFGEDRGKDLIDVWVRRLFSKVDRLDPDELMARPAGGSSSSSSRR